MSTSKKRGRPSRTPEEELVEWHTSLHWLLKIVGVGWFANKLSLFNSEEGCAQLRKISSGRRHEATSSLVLLKKTKPDGPAHKCAIKWIEARARQLGAEADAIDLLVDAFELELPNRVASCLMGVLLDVAVTVKKKHGEKEWRTQFLKGLPSINVSRHVGMGEDGIMVLPVMANSPIKDFTKLTFDKAIKAWVEQYSGHKLSRRTIFRELGQRGLSANK